MDFEGVENVREIFVVVNLYIDPSNDILSPPPSSDDEDTDGSDLDSEDSDLDFKDSDGSDLDFEDFDMGDILEDEDPGEDWEEDHEEDLEERLVEMFPTPPTSDDDEPAEDQAEPMDE